MRNGIARRVRQIIKDSGLSQNEWARAQRVSGPHLSDLLNGKRDAGVVLAKRLAKATGVPAFEFLSAKKRALFPQQHPQANPSPDRSA